MAANSFTNKCKASWRGSPSGLVHPKFIQSSLHNSDASSTLTTQHNKQSRPLPSAIHHQNYRLQNAWTPRPRKARTLRDWAMREIGANNVTGCSMTAGLQETSELSLRFVSLIPCFDQKQTCRFSPLNVLFMTSALASHAGWQQHFFTATCPD